MILSYVFGHWVDQMQPALDEDLESRLAEFEHKATAESFEWGKREVLAEGEACFKEIRYWAAEASKGVLMLLNLINVDSVPEAEKGSFSSKLDEIRKKADELCVQIVAFSSYLESPGTNMTIMPARLLQDYAAQHPNANLLDAHEKLYSAWARGYEEGVSSGMDTCNDEYNRHMHVVQTALTAMGGFSGQLQDKPYLSEADQHRLHEITGTVRGTETLCKQYSWRKMNMEEFDLGQVVLDAYRHYAGQDRNPPHIMFDITGPHAVVLDRGVVQEILQELFRYIGDKNGNGNHKVIIEGMERSLEIIFDCAFQSPGKLRGNKPEENERCGYHIPMKNIVSAAVKLAGRLDIIPQGERTQISVQFPRDVTQLSSYARPYSPPQR